MSETGRIIEAVAHLWPEGPDLFGDRWEEVKEQLLPKLAYLDSHPGEEEPVEELLAIFELHPDANKRLVTLLGPAEVLKGTYKPLPGRHDAISASRLKCPEQGCDFSWARRVAGQRPPKCPQHHLPLVPAAD